jgi:hypothetical protein
MRVWPLLFLPSLAHAGFVVEPFLQRAEPTAITVAWESDDGDATLSWGATDALDQAAADDEQVSPGGTLHHARITGLTPGQRYWYRVTAGAETSGPHAFVAPETSGPTRLLAMSDMQRDGSRPDQFASIVADGVLPWFGDDLPAALDLVLVAGDLVDNGWSYGEWAQTFFAPAAPLFRQVPLYPVPGNHEADTPYFFDYFDLPANGTDEHWWWFDHSNVRIVGLDSNSGYAGQTQLAWLEELLAETCADETVDFVFAQLHHPFRSELWLPGENPWTGQVQRRMEQFSTDCGKPSVHFFGHTHGYSRGNARDHQHLMVNVATAGGRIDRWGEYPQRDYPEFLTTDDEYGFVVVEVEDGEEPWFRLRRVTRGDADAVRDNEVTDDVTVRAGNAAPEAPTAASPLDDEPVAPDGLLLVASAYSDPDGDAQSAAHWQVSTDCGSWDEPAFDGWWQHRNEYFGEDRQAGDDLSDAWVEGLEPETPHCWRVRYRDVGLVWSPWSTPQPFTTGPSEWTDELLTNGGAEDGTEGWTVLEGTFESVESNTCDGGSAFEGQRYFAVGGICEDQTDFARVEQRRDLALWTGVIDEGFTTARLQGRIADWGGDDEPSVLLEALDAGGAVVASAGPVSTRSPQWQAVDEQLALPAGTRSLRVELTGTRNAGSDNDSYVDALSLTLRLQRAPVEGDDDDSVDPTEPSSCSGCGGGALAWLLVLPLGLRRYSGSGTEPRRR